VRSAVRATTRLVVDAGGGAPRVRWAHAWPVVLRRTGPRRVHLVHAAGGPLGGDELALEVEVGAGAAVAVRSAGATLVQPGAGATVPARWSVTARVGPCGRLDWAPEPTVVSDGAALGSSLRVELASGAAATVREVVVLGRHGQVGGRYAGRLEVVVDGVPLLAHTTVLDGADPVLCGPAGTAGARAVGALVCAGAEPADAPGAGSGETADVRWAQTSLEGPGTILLAVGTPAAVVAVLDAAATALTAAATAPAAPAASVPAPDVRHAPPVAGVTCRAAQPWTAP
jgi:urease accessory protein